MNKAERPKLIETSPRTTKEILLENCRQHFELARQKAQSILDLKKNEIINFFRDTCTRDDQPQGKEMADLFSIDFAKINNQANNKTLDSTVFCALRGAALHINPESFSSNEEMFKEYSRIVIEHELNIEGRVQAESRYIDFGHDGRYYEV